MRTIQLQENEKISIYTKVKQSIIKSVYLISILLFDDWIVLDAARPSYGK